ncbi:hypothetical protein CEXT_660851 [Caerostris extrusa]|uniref:Uncharacterized protein n=1 Tax=Caerostris extrusa TaxID=172846 RepID=A0AAV4MTZ2_CAEEX|nr:hypothetical protein CEXT_660851 [Caerostris extrusa]
MLPRDGALGHFVSPILLLLHHYPHTMDIAHGCVFLQNEGPGWDASHPHVSVGHLSKNKAEFIAEYAIPMKIIELSRNRRGISHNSQKQTHVFVSLVGFSNEHFQLDGTRLMIFPRLVKTPPRSPKGVETSKTRRKKG